MENFWAEFFSEPVVWAYLAAVAAIFVAIGRGRAFPEPRTLDVPFGDVCVSATGRDPAVTIVGDSLTVRGAKEVKVVRPATSGRT